MRTNNKFENPVICIAGQAPADTRIEIILTKIMIQRQIERFAILVQPLQIPQRTELVVSLQSTFPSTSKVTGPPPLDKLQSTFGLIAKVQRPERYPAIPFSSAFHAWGEAYKLVLPTSRLAPQNKPLSESCGAMYLIRTFSPSNWVWPSLVLVVSK